MGLPTAIMANMTAEQLEAYTLHLRIEEISQKLRINDVVPADGDRYVLLYRLKKIILRYIDHHHHLLSTTTSVAVSTHANTATASDLKRNATN